MPRINVNYAALDSLMQRCNLPTDGKGIGELHRASNDIAGKQIPNSTRYFAPLKEKKDRRSKEAFSKRWIALLFDKGDRDQNREKDRALLELLVHAAIRRSASKLDPVQELEKIIAKEATPPPPSNGDKTRLHQSLLDKVVQKYREDALEVVLPTWQLRKQFIKDAKSQAKELNLLPVMVDVSSKTSRGWLSVWNAMLSKACFETGAKLETANDIDQASGRISHFISSSEKSVFLIVCGLDEFFLRQLSILKTQGLSEQALSNFRIESESQYYAIEKLADDGAAVTMLSTVEADVLFAECGVGIDQNLVESGRIGNCIEPIDESILEAEFLNWAKSELVRDEAAGKLDRPLQEILLSESRLPNIFSNVKATLLRDGITDVGKCRIALSAEKKNIGQRIISSFLPTGLKRVLENRLWSEAKTKARIDSPKFRALVDARILRLNSKGNTLDLRCAEWDEIFETKTTESASKETSSN